MRQGTPQDCAESMARLQPRNFKAASWLEEPKRDLLARPYFACADGARVGRARRGLACATEVLPNQSSY
jgi:hypothetical protein